VLGPGTLVSSDIGGIGWPVGDRAVVGRKGSRCNVLSSSSLSSSMSQCSTLVKDEIVLPPTMSMTLLNTGSPSRKLDFPGPSGEWLAQ